MVLQQAKVKHLLIISAVKVVVTVKTKALIPQGQANDQKHPMLHLQIPISMQMQMQI
jgi:hypothetical protein